MKTITLSLTLLGAILLSLLSAVLAHAQRVFVSATGLDGNPCTFALPCRSFQHAHDVVAAGGEIDVLDPAGYGPVIINKAISIQGHGFSGISASSGNAITINAGSSNKVSLRGLLIDGLGTGANGILFTGGAALAIHDSVVRRFSTGISISPNGSTAASGVLDGLTVEDNASTGILFNGNSSTGGVAFTVRNSVIAQNGNGLVDSSCCGGAFTRIMVQSSTIANSSSNGLTVDGDAAELRLTGLVVTGNSFAISETGGGVLASSGNNAIIANIFSDGLVLGTFALK
jgi:hypothetical protein